MDANRVRELIATAKTTADELETYAGPIAFLAEGYEQRGAELERLEAERDTLREALERIAEGTIPPRVISTHPATEASYAAEYVESVSEREFARAVLGGDLPQDE